MTELFSRGCSGIKIKWVDDGMSIDKLTDLWAIYYGKTIPYIQGILLPMQKELNDDAEMKGMSFRTMLLTSWRDTLILPDLEIFASKLFQSNSHLNTNC
jgi:hypothetical protein